MTEMNLRQRSETTDEVDMTDYKEYLDGAYDYDTDTLNTEKAKKIAEQKKRKVQYNTSGCNRYRKKYFG